MSNAMNRIASDLQKIMSDSNNKKTSGFDTQAVVTRIDGDTAWVRFPGGEDDTPVSRTTNAGIGDEVRVRVSGGRAWLLGNVTNPPTDDTQANVAKKVANKADTKATDALDAIDGLDVRVASADKRLVLVEGNIMALGSRVESAETSLTTVEEGITGLNTRVEDAETALSSAEEKIDAIESDVGKANALLDDMQEAAEQADTTLTQIFQDAKDAKDLADDADKSAKSAFSSASNALDQLSVVENVVGVLDLISTHGTYTQITDTEAVAESGKWYFELVDGAYKTVYVDEGDSVTGYYILTDIDEAVTNYVSSHLALTDDGLSLQQDDSDYRLLISTGGVSIIGADGGTVASYGTETVIGDKKGFHVQIDATELGFYQGKQRVAYINNNQLYITQSVVLQQMDIGTPISDGGFGQWSWKIHKNVNGENNLYLKWMG